MSSDFDFDPSVESEEAALAFPRFEDSSPSLPVFPKPHTLNLKP
jgi:hypothetical protein